jgi:hypothetical protein
MYRLRLISPIFGVDETGPLHPNQKQAQEAALKLLKVYHDGDLKIEIRRVVDFHWQKSEIVATVGNIKPRLPHHHPPHHRRS